MTEPEENQDALSRKTQTAKAPEEDVKVEGTPEEEKPTSGSKDNHVHKDQPHTDTRASKKAHKDKEDRCEKKEYMKGRENLKR